MFWLIRSTKGWGWLLPEKEWDKNSGDMVEADYTHDVRKAYQYTELHQAKAEVLAGREEIVSSIEVALTTDWFTRELTEDPSCPG